MDQRLKNIIDNMDAMKIGLDEQFRFGCTMCGKCCINREDILLSPKDVYRMSKELGLTPDGLFSRYCEAYVGQDSRIPIVRLKPRGPARRCPLLRNRKCLVHRAKPVVCAMFPIGRCLVADNPEEGIRDFSKTRLEYIFVNPICGDRSETHTVREYLELFGIPAEDDVYFMKWNQTILKMGSIFREVEKAVSMKAMNTVWTAAFAAVYMNYDTNKDFMLQFDENTKRFFDMMNSALHDAGFNPKA